MIGECTRSSCSSSSPATSASVRSRTAAIAASACSASGEGGWSLAPAVTPGAPWRSAGASHAADATLLLSVPTLPLARPEAFVARRRIGEWPTADNLARWDPHHERRYEPDELLTQLGEAGWVATQTVPLFGTATTALLCIGEPVSHSVFGRTIPLAHYGDRLDRLWTRFDRHSSLAVVCRPATD